METLIIILIVLWALGLLGGVGGNFVYILLVVALLLFLFGRGGV